MSVSLAHLSCRELVELVTAYFEGDMSKGERKRFEAHLAECDGCTTYVEQMRRTIELTGSLRVDDVPREAEEKLLRVFRGWRSD
jgi:anti-sigma factor RsiW